MSLNRFLGRSNPHKISVGDQYELMIRNVSVIGTEREKREKEFKKGRKKKEKIQFKEL